MPTSKGQYSFENKLVKGLSFNGVKEKQPFLFEALHGRSQFDVNGV